MIHIFSTAEGLLTQEDRVTADGLQEVFETNVFGHFILVKRLWAQEALVSAIILKACVDTSQACLLSPEIMARVKSWSTELGVSLTL